MQNVYGVFVISPNLEIIKTSYNGGFSIVDGNLLHSFDTGSHDKLKALSASVFSESEDIQELELVAVIKGCRQLVKGSICLLDSDQAILVIQNLQDEAYESQLALMALMQEQSTTIRRIEKEKATANKLYNTAVEDMTKLNNSLVTANREELKQKKRLDRLNKQLNEILGMTAHDIRNALLRIQGFSKLLTDNFTDPTMSEEEQGEVLIRIFESGEEGLLLLNDILDRSKIESGHLELNTKSTDLLELLKRSISNHKAIADRKKISLVLDDHSKSIFANADQHRLQQVLGNFISNAIKFSDEGKVVTLGVTSNRDKTLEIWVQDQGMGMSEASIKAINSGRKALGREGTLGEKSNGLGLAICKKVIDAHGGTLGITSEEGKGSRFTIGLKALSNEKQQQSIPQSSPRHPSKSSLKTQKCLGRVLLLDDQALNINLLKTILKKHCQAIDAFTNPLEALKMQESWDLIISDQEMPQMKGVDVIQHLKKQGRIQHSVLLTAHQLKAEVEENIRAKGVDHVLEKPLNKQALMNLF